MIYPSVVQRIFYTEERVAYQGCMQSHIRTISNLFSKLIPLLLKIFKFHNVINISCFGRSHDAAYKFCPFDIYCLLPMSLFLISTLGSCESIACKVHINKSLDCKEANELEESSTLASLTEEMTSS